MEIKRKILSLHQEIEIIKEKIGMLIIHIITQEDTRDFSRIYEGLERHHDVQILINPLKGEARHAMMTEQDTIVLIGHGNEYGLFNHNFNGFVVDSNSVQFLRNKNVIGIWCHASTFADRYDLSGFFTSMFISNVDELVTCAFPLFENCDNVIQEENVAFAKRIHTLLITSKDETHSWADRLREVTQDSPHKFVHYNYEAMWSKNN